MKRRYVSQSGKGFCNTCGRNDQTVEGLCKRCRKSQAKTKRGLVVGETYSYDELSDILGVEINEDSRIVVVD